MDGTLDQSGFENLLGGTGDAETNNPPSAQGAEEGTGAAQAAQGGTQAAAWMSQLPKEMRDNADYLSKLSGFKSIGELAGAYLSKGSEAAQQSEIDLSDVTGLLQKLGAPKEGEAYDFEKDLKNELAKFGEIARGATLTREQAAKMLDGYRSIIEARTQSYLAEARARAPELSQALVSEFGADGAAWYRKAIEGNKLNTLLAQSGLGANKELARALVLLGREMSEDYTPRGGTRRGETEPSTWREGARFDRT